MGQWALGARFPLVRSGQRARRHPTERRADGGVTRTFFGRWRAGAGGRIMSSDEAGFIDVETLIMDGCRAGVAGKRVLNNTNGEPGEALVAEQRWLMRYVARRLSADLRAAVGAEDVVQETFVAAL